MPEAVPRIDPSKGRISCSQPRMPAELRPERMSGDDGDLLRPLAARVEAQDALTRVFVCADRRDWDGLGALLGELAVGGPAAVLRHRHPRSTRARSTLSALASVS